MQRGITLIEVLLVLSIQLFFFSIVIQQILGMNLDLPGTLKYFPSAKEYINIYQHYYKNHITHFQPTTLQPAAHSFHESRSVRGERSESKRNPLTDYMADKRSERLKEELQYHYDSLAPIE